MNMETVYTKVFKGGVIGEPGFPKFLVNKKKSVKSKKLKKKKKKREEVYKPNKQVINFKL